jgi:hypothetical protein
VKPMTLLEPGWPARPRLDRHQFEAAFGRPPRMTGALDYFEAMREVDAGAEVIDVTCAMDELESYVVSQSA